jgi:hypothetical protein
MSLPNPVSITERMIRMATQPDIPPDIIEPQSPPESPPLPSDPVPGPGQPAETPPLGPDIDQPGRGPDEIPPPLYSFQAEQPGESQEQTGFLRRGLLRRAEDRAVEAERLGSTAVEQPFDLPDRPSDHAPLSSRHQPRQIAARLFPAARSTAQHID